MRLRYETIWNVFVLWSSTFRALASPVGGKHGWQGSLGMGCIILVHEKANLDRLLGPDLRPDKVHVRLTSTPKE